MQFLVLKTKNWERGHRIAAEYFNFTVNISKVLFAPCIIIFDPFTGFLVLVFLVPRIFTNGKIGLKVWLGLG